MATMDLRMRVKTQGIATVVEVGGEIDLHSAPQLRAELLKAVEAVTPRVVIDLGEVTFIDSTGIGVLVGALKRAREKGGALNFCGIQSRVKRVFEITGLMSALPLFESREAATQAFGESGNE
ncbi:anti-sigma factor antagonist [bacterium]|nr:MAG: anti-sigma factor antagonist [bacterium]